MRSTDERTDGLVDLGRRHHAGLTPLGFAAVDEEQGGNAHHVVSLSGVRVFVDVHFDDGELVAGFVFELGEDGWHHPTGSAPRGGEIDEHGFVAANEVCKLGRLGGRFHNKRIAICLPRRLKFLL